MIHLFQIHRSFRSQWKNFSHVSPLIQRMFPERSLFLWRNLMWGFHDVEVCLEEKKITVSEREFFSLLQALVNHFPIRTLPRCSELGWLEHTTFIWRGKQYKIGHVVDHEEHEYGWFIVQSR